MLLPSTGDMATNTNRNNNKMLKKTPSALSLSSPRSIDRTAIDEAEELPLAMNSPSRQRRYFGMTPESNMKLEEEAVGRFPKGAQAKKKKDVIPRVPASGAASKTSVGRNVVKAKGKS